LVGPPSFVCVINVELLSKVRVILVTNLVGVTISVRDGLSCTLGNAASRVLLHEPSFSIENYDQEHSDLVISVTKDISPHNLSSDWVILWIWFSRMNVVSRWFGG
jgi:hypothetical protein